VPEASSDGGGAHTRIDDGRGNPNSVVCGKSAQLASVIIARSHGPAIGTHEDQMFLPSPDRARRCRTVDEVGATDVVIHIAVRVGALVVLNAARSDDIDVAVAIKVCTRRGRTNNRRSTRRCHCGGLGRRAQKRLLGEPALRVAGCRQASKGVLESGHPFGSLDAPRQHRRVQSSSLELACRPSLKRLG
jgi:hypothetical protein